MNLPAPAAVPTRYSTGVPGMDEMLGGGLLPGTLTVLVGATGIGKTQFGVRFAEAGATQEGHRGIICDLTSRGDSQGHLEYSSRLCGRALLPHELDRPFDPARFLRGDDPASDYLRVFGYQGRRVTHKDLDFDQWRDWQAEFAHKLQIAIEFFYGAFRRGVRRAVIDGVEPVEKATDSIQFDLFEYIQHQILRKDDDWLARDLLRQDFRAHQAQVEAVRYDKSQLTSVLLWTSRDAMLESLLDRPLEEGDLLAGANTVIYLGKIREGSRFGRAFYIAKHRGSAHSDEIIPYRIDEQGLRLG